MDRNFSESGLDRTLHWLVPALMLVWLIRVSIGVNYQQSFIYPLVYLVALTSFIALWRAKKPFFKLPLLAFSLALTLFFGRVLIDHSGLNCSFQRVAVQLMLEEAADEYSALIARGQPNAGCDNWPCIGDTLFGLGNWNGLIVFAEQGNRTHYFNKVPKRDPWGCRYRLERESDKLVFRSSGPDRKLWTRDDIVADVTPHE